MSVDLTGLLKYNNPDGLAATQTSAQKLQQSGVGGKNDTVVENSVKPIKGDSPYARTISIDISDEALKQLENSADPRDRAAVAIYRDLLANIPPDLKKKMKDFEITAEKQPDRSCKFTVKIKGSDGAIPPNYEAKLLGFAFTLTEEQMKDEGRIRKCVGGKMKAAAYTTDLSDIPAGELSTLDLNTLLAMEMVLKALSDFMRDQLDTEKKEDKEQKKDDTAIEKKRDERKEAEKQFDKIIQLKKYVEKLIGDKTAESFFASRIRTELNGKSPKKANTIDANIKIEQARIGHAAAGAMMQVLGGFRR